MDVSTYTMKIVLRASSLKLITVFVNNTRRQITFKCHRSDGGLHKLARAGVGNRFSVTYIPVGKGSSIELDQETNRNHSATQTTSNKIYVTCESCLGKSTHSQRERDAAGICRKSLKITLKFMAYRSKHVFGIRHNSSILCWELSWLVNR